MHNNEETCPITPSGVSHPHNMLHTGTYSTVDHGSDGSSHTAGTWEACAIYIP